jgi:hypothetical protein
MGNFLTKSMGILLDARGKVKCRDLLQGVYAGHGRSVDTWVIKTLALMITGMLLGPHVQLFAIAMCLPIAAKPTSLTRRLERFVADERIVVQTLFEPFVIAMIASLGNETAYLVIDCTQAGPHCRTLFACLPPGRLACVITTPFCRR